MSYVLTSVEAPAGSFAEYRHGVAARGLPKLGPERADPMVTELGYSLWGNGFAGVRCGCAAALGEYGKDARPVLPILLYELEDRNEPDQRVREAITNALRRIAPEVLEQARRQEGRNLRQKN